MHRVRHDNAAHVSTYAGRYFAEPVPKHEIPPRDMPPRAAYQIVHDELNLDGNPALNLASFVTSWMEPEADQLALETLNKNMIDQDEYPQTEVIHERVVSMVARLFNAPPECESVGTATIGSSEAIMLALLAHKRTWKRRREAAGLPADKPNLVLGADVHTCWEKFTNYFEVELRSVPMDNDHFTLSAEGVRAHVDENTIAVGAVVGTTYTGQMDDLEDIDALLSEIEQENGWKIPLHVDAASGGFVLPFYAPERVWDFRLKNVRSINVSNHKFGLVYPGMGTVVFRDKSDLPDELIFHINYLGGDMPNYSLNFSRPSTSVLLQYFAFLRLGREGYERVTQNVIGTARFLFDELGRLGEFDLMNEGLTIPVVPIKAKDPEKVDVFALSERLRERGWIVPAYTLPPNADDIAVLRIVVKENFSRDMAELLVADIDTALKRLGGRGEGDKARAGKARQPVC